MPATTNVLDQARRLSGQLVAWRRHLHAHPELSGEEVQTAAFVAQHLREMGYQPRTGVGGHGVVADIEIDGPPKVALRADMDALPITEQTQVPYASTRPGVMHACGHDAHTAMLLGAARILAEQRDALRHSVRLIFQPHEELFPGGAPAMIEAGALEGIRAIFGIHIASALPTGTLGTRPGAFMAAVNPLAITVRGKGGHAAMPEQCVDPIVTAAMLITALQTVVSRTIAISDPAVVSVTAIHGGSADNVIPEQVELIGTIRTFDPSIRQHVCDRVAELAQRVCEAHRASAEVRIDPGYPVLINDEKLTAGALEAAKGVGILPGRLQTLPPIGGGEDFAYYCERVPGAFVFLGAANEAKHCSFPHHHPRFNIDEDALPTGAALHAKFALDYREDE